MDGKKAIWQVYILECKGGSLYTGMTCDLDRRYKEHVRGSSRYTSYNPPVKVLYTETCSDRSGALKRECQIKSWPRPRKLALIVGKKPALISGKNAALITGKKPALRSGKKHKRTK